MQYIDQKSFILLQLFSIIVVSSKLSAFNIDNNRKYILSTKLK